MNNAISYDELLAFVRETRERSQKLIKERSDFAVNNPPLDENTVIDENKSVRWNREEVARCNRSRGGKLAAYTAKINQCDRDVNDKIMDYLCSVFTFGRAVARVVFREAYEDGHHAGYEEVAAYAHSYGLFAEQVMDAADL